MRIIRFGRLMAAAVLLCLMCLTFGVAAGSAQKATPGASNPEFAAMGVWDPATSYAQDDIVNARGSAWISLQDGNLNKVPGQTVGPNTDAWWQLLARGSNPTGAWSNATKYQPDDLITHNGQTYRAKLTQINRQPNNPNFWELLAAKGADGEQGLQGPQGPPGPQGPAGPNSGVAGGSQAAPAISFSDDADTGIYSPQAGKIALVENGTLFLHNIGGGFNTALGLSALAANTGINNAALGDSALAANTDGHNNTAIGRLALTANTTGDANVAIGSTALAANTTGNQNTAIGNQALASNTASGNTAIGNVALFANTSGVNNTAVGMQALASNATSGNNTALGYQALALNTGVFNTAVGSSALSANTASGANTAVGYQALTANVANGNTAVGYQALAANTDGGSNTALGRSALAANMTGAQNTAVGYEALNSNTTGASNTALGKQALENNTTGGNNIAIGLGALSDNQTGANNIAIGTNAGSGSATLNNSISIGGNGVGGTSNTIKIGSQGTQSAAFIAGISGINVTGAAVFVSSSGQLGVQSSSRRYKDDIETIADVSAMLAKLRPVTFRYKQAEKDGAKPKQYGLIAEEAEETSADLAHYNEDGRIETVKYHFLPPLLLAGWQAQQKAIAALTARDRQQAARIEELEERVAAVHALDGRLRRLEALLPQTKAAALQ